MTAVCGRRSIFGALSREDPLYAHESGYAVASSWASESLSQSWTPVGLATAGELLPDAFTQPKVCQLPRPGLAPTRFPIIITAARDQECLA